MKNRLRQLLLGEKKDFQQLCQQHNLQLDYSMNRAGLTIASAIFREREYADYFPFYEKATVIDIGAHFGYFSLFAASNLAPESRIFAIEADKKNVAVLEANLRANFYQNLSTHHLAMAGQSGKRTLHQSRAENNSLIENYQLLDDAHEQVQITAISLADFMEQHKLHHIDFLKMDCEGAEYEILLSATDDLLSTIDTISMEFHDLKTLQGTSWRLVEKLQSAGFKVVKYAHEPTRRNLNYGKLIGTRRLS